MNRERLLNVAKALRESPDPEMFDMGREIHASCGTPACAWGHYAARTDLQDVWKVKFSPYGSFYRVVFAHPENHGGCTEAEFSDAEVLHHFDITDEQHCELFEPEGCGGAQTPVEAAEYIEDFVRRHEVQP